MASENKLFTDGVVVIILTACCYLSAYAYEVGYCSALGIPHELINITISNILSTGLFAVIMLCLAYQYLNTPITILNIVENKILNKLFYKHGLVLAISIVIASNFGFEIKQSLFTLLIPTLTLFADLIAPLIGKKDSYMQELDRWLSISDKNDKGIISSIQDIQAKNIVSYLLIIMFLLLILLSFGHREASNKSVFPTTESGIILRIYNNQAIAAKINQKTKTVLPEFELIDINNKPFKLIKLGPLKQYEAHTKKLQDNNLFYYEN